MRYRATLYGYLVLAAVNAQRWTSECGTSTPRGRPTIVNGVQAEYGAFPWHVGVYKNNGTGYYDQICGGTLISPDIVVSAAHCFYDDRYGKVQSTGDFMIAAGKYHRMFYWPEPYVQRSSVKGIEKADKYIGRSGNYGADIALIRLEIRFNITELVKPVCIDWDNKYESTQLRSGQMGKVMGWGVTETSEPTNNLREIDLPVITYNDCSAAVPEDFQGFISPTDKFCAGYLNGSSVCTGDSGGGLCFKTNRLWYLRGIVSASPAPSGLDLPCNNNQYAAFTNIGPFLDWIRAAYDGTGIGIRKSNGCILPKPPKGGSFEVSCQGECDIDPGSTVPTSSILFHKCNGVDGYMLKGNRASLCTENGWNSIPTCIKKCPPLALGSTDTAVCGYKGKIVSCGSPMEPGTRVSLACETGTQNSTDEITCLENGGWDRPVLQCARECGRASSSVNLFGYNEDGDSIEHTTWPWDVIIKRKDWIEISGILIKPDLVLSDADGVYFFDENGHQYDTSNFTVLAGGYFNLNSTTRHFTEDSAVKTFNYVKDNRNPDIPGLALLRLVTPFKMTTWVSPICIDWENRLIGEHLRKGNIGTVPTGLYEVEGSAKRKSDINLAYVPRKDCFSLLQDTSKSYVSSGSFCADNSSSASQSGSCGDLLAGAGLSFESDGLWYLRGVLDRCIPDSVLLRSSDVGYTVFTNVGHYLESLRRIYDSS